MPALDLSPLSGRYLSFPEREEIALLRVQGKGVREIARQLGRDPSTISRELRRNAATRGGNIDYRASVAQWKAELFAQRPKVAKMVANEALQRYVQERLAGQIRHPNGTVRTRATPATLEWPQSTAQDIKIVNGFRDGVLSRSPNVFGSIFPMTHR
jgi:transposase-like protein